MVWTSESNRWTTRSRQHLVHEAQVNLCPSNLGTAMGSALAIADLIHPGRVLTTLPGGAHARRPLVAWMSITDMG